MERFAVVLAAKRERPNLELRGIEKARAVDELRRATAAESVMVSFIIVFWDKLRGKKRVGESLG